MTDLQWTEVDQVTTVWADTPGPLRAGLFFRTGRVDETLATAGVTHLIEHLSFTVVNDPSHQHNGFVGGVVTSFFTMGQPKDVSNFLAKICAGLNSLPGDRLESEKQVLAAENAARVYNFSNNLMIWRYGAAGYGLLGLPEVGLKKITLEQLQNYAAQRFTRKNAVLWLSGPVPDDLRLTLPDGIKCPTPPLTPIQETFPSWFVENQCGGVAAGVTVPRVYAATIFCEIASRRLYNRLRTDQSVSYAPSVSYDPLNADIAHLVLYADSDQNRRAELANLFGEVFQQLDVLEDEEFESARNRILDHWIGPLTPPPSDRNVMELQRSAMDWILGNEHESWELAASQLNLVTLDEVTSFAREVQANAMFALPGEAKVLPCFGTMVPVSSVPVVQGDRAKNMDAPVQQEELVYGPDGVSLVWPDGSHRTVRYSQLAAVLSYDDGGLNLIGFDASGIMVEPTLWRDGPSICRKIHQHVPEHLLIDQGSRPAEAIPKPTTTAWERFRTRLLNVEAKENDPFLKYIVYVFLFVGILIFMVFIQWVFRYLLGL
jgi:hypothetical protein